jgi:hypothetical protein
VCWQLGTEQGVADATLGFGINVNWEGDKGKIPEGHTMPFMEALVTALDGLLLRAVLPRWLISLTKRGRRALCGYEEMEVSHLSKLHQSPTSNSEYRHICWK